MLNYIWGILIIISIICSVLTGNMESLGQSTIDGAKSGLEVILIMLPMLVLWSGMMEIAQKSGLTSVLAKIFLPILKKLFPDIDPESDAFKFISMNISANLLGLGNAATPFGLRAMGELKRLSPHSDTATDSMVIFVTINTASIQLLPTMVGALRSAAGSKSAFDILLCVWVTSVIALIFGVSIAKIFMKNKKAYTKA